MNPVYAIADNIISPLGKTSKENFSNLLKGKDGVNVYPAVKISDQPFCASLFPDDFWNHQAFASFSKFEQLLVLSIEDVLKQTNLNAGSGKTGWIISSTKGNIHLLEACPVTPQLRQEISLVSSAEKIQTHFGFARPPVIISHACISGLLALITAKRMLQAGLYENVIIAGADIITRFILSGFQSLYAVSPEPCRPFDAERKGINLGEAAASVILSIHKPEDDNSIEVKGGAVSNDANHISGTSRTGEELFEAIKEAMKKATVTANDIDFISLHGTATLFNDDMESKAIALALLNEVPANSLKGYYGHTLGAAGLVESVVSMHSLKNNTILPTRGFHTIGTAENINITSAPQHTHLKTCLKTASGFGGCNAALILEKNIHDQLL